MTPTPADEALAREITNTCIELYPTQIGSKPACTVNTAKLAQLIAAHVAAQAPSGMVEALEEVMGCFNAAYAEGLHEKMMEAVDTEPGSLVDLIQRRLLYAYERTIPDALAAHKAQPVADVRGMVEALGKVQYQIADLRKKAKVSGELSGAQHGMLLGLQSAETHIEHALASARHAMGGEVKA